MYSTHGSAKGPLTPHSTHMWRFLSLSEGDQASEACPWRITGRLEHGLIFMKLNMAYYSSRETMVPVQLPCPLFCPQILRHLYNQKKHFTKMQKHVGLASTKKTTKQDGAHMTICSQITIPTSIFPTTHTIIPYSLFWNGCVYLCIVNSRIGLWVGVCIEGSRE